jgi:prepilin-type N-terminal cleavage/methylation domain-containing protein
MKKREQRGFSLIELLIVVAIIGIIAAIAVPNMIKAQQATHETAAIGNVKAIQQGQALYSVTKGHGKYASLQDLGADGDIDPGLAPEGNSGRPEPPGRHSHPISSALDYGGAVNQAPPL